MHHKTWFSEWKVSLCVSARNDRHRSDREMAVFRWLITVCSRSPGSGWVPFCCWQLIWSPLHPGHSKVVRYVLLAPDLQNISPPVNFIALSSLSLGTSHYCRGKHPRIHGCILQGFIYSRWPDRAGASWWLSGKESICQGRRHGFDP